MTTLIVLAASLSIALAAPAKPTVWRMDYVLPAGDPETVMLQQACDDIFTFTEGRLKIDVYPSFSLKLNPARQLANIRDGLMEAACIQVQMVEGQDPSLSVVEAPGVWATKEDQAKAVDALNPFKTKLYAEQYSSQFVATKMMTVQINGIFSNRPLNSLADLKGLKVRVPSRRQLVGLQTLGAAPQTMVSGEVYMALKTGVLDATSSGTRSLIYQKWGEVVKYGLEGNVAEAVAQDIVINKKAWDAISPDIQEIVTMVFSALAAKQRVMAVMPGMSNHWKRQVEAMGVKVNTMTHAEQIKMEDLFAEEWYKDLEKANPRTKEAWEIVRPFTRPR
ncbi:MAG: TRAP transporter substrate-binding protein DctP [Syntrophaceae bacterium]|nr:TRAP transporter substrate-binding protein DctP [Syntrophaceae bacterium]